MSLLRYPVLLLFPAAGLLGLWMLHRTGLLGVLACRFRSETGLPCFGCGMSRSLLALLRGDPGTTLLMHPFAVPMVIAAGGMALLALMPARLRLAAAAWLQRRDPAPGRLMLFLLIAFGLYGTARIVWVWLMGESIW